MLLGDGLRARARLEYRSAAVFGREPGGDTARWRSSGWSPGSSPLEGGLQAWAWGVPARSGQREGQATTSEAPVAAGPSKREPDQAVDPIQLCYQSRGGSGEEGW